MSKLTQSSFGGSGDGSRTAVGENRVRNGPRGTGTLPTKPALKGPRAREGRGLKRRFIVSSD